MEDFRSDEQKETDKALIGTWWRCREHALTEEPILLGQVAYCPKDDCNEQVRLVHSAINDPNANAQARSVWRKSSDLFLAPVKKAEKSAAAKKKRKRKKSAAK